MMRRYGVMSKLSGVAVVALGISLCSGVAWADGGASQSNEIKGSAVAVGQNGTLLNLCGTKVGLAEQRRSSLSLRRYMLDSLPGVEMGVGGTREVALSAQTEPKEHDSVFDVNSAGDLALPEDEAVTTPEPLYDKHDGTAERQETKDAMRAASRAYFAGEMFGIMRPTILEECDNQIDVGFQFETKKRGQMTKYSVPLTYHRKLSSSSELCIGWTPVTWNAKGAGFDNGNVSYKCNIFKNADNALGFKVGCDFPTGTPRFSCVGFEPSLTFSYSYYLPEKWTLTANVGVAASNDHDLHKSYVKVEYGFDVTKGIGDDNFISLGYSGKNRDAVYNYNNTSKVSLGFGHNFSPTSSMYFGVSHGCNSYGTDWKPSISYSQKF